MPTLQQPLPLNHPPPPQPSSQPPRKKLRSINAKPKLTLEQVTDNQVVQAALRIGRRARANPPKAGEEHLALDKLLKRMQAWAHQVAPHYSLAEFVVAAQSIAGNRELRPMLNVFRLAELRDVTTDNPNEQPQQPEQSDVPIQRANTNPTPISPDIAPVDADVGPIEADVGPNEDDWDELDIVPDEVIEVRSLPNHQLHSPDHNRDHRCDEKLNSDVEARIERNRLAALERRRAAMARMTTEKGKLNANKENNPSLTNHNEETEEDHPIAKANTHLQSGPETEEPSKESNVHEQPELTMSKSEAKQPNPETSLPKLTASEKETDSSQEPKSGGESRVKTLTRGVSEDEDLRVPSERANASAEQEGRSEEKGARKETDFPERAPQTADGPGETREQEHENNENSRPTELNKCIWEDKTEAPNVTKSVEITEASGSDNDEGVDMEILAEFQEGSEV